MHGSDADAIHSSSNGLNGVASAAQLDLGFAQRRISVIDGVAVDEQSGSNVELDVVSDNLLPGLSEGLIGMESGESKEIPVHLPDDYRRTG